MPLCGPRSVQIVLALVWLSATGTAATSIATVNAVGRENRTKKGYIPRLPPASISRRPSCLRCVTCVRSVDSWAQHFGNFFQSAGRAHDSSLAGKRPDSLGFLRFELGIDWNRLQFVGSTFGVRVPASQPITSRSCRSASGYATVAWLGERTSTKRLMPRSTLAPAACASSLDYLGRLRTPRSEDT